MSHSRRWLCPRPNLEAIRLEIMQTACSQTLIWPIGGWRAFGTAPKLPLAQMINTCTDNVGLKQFVHGKFTRLKGSPEFIQLKERNNEILESSWWHYAWNINYTGSREWGQSLSLKIINLRVLRRSMTPIEKFFTTRIFAIITSDIKLLFVTNSVILFQNPYKNFY